MCTGRFKGLLPHLLNQPKLQYFPPIVVQPQKRLVSVCSCLLPPPYSELILLESIVCAKNPLPLTSIACNLVLLRDNQREIPTTRILQLLLLSTAQSKINPHPVLVLLLSFACVSVCLSGGVLEGGGKSESASPAESADKRTRIPPRNTPKVSSCLFASSRRKSCHHFCICLETRVS